MRRTASPPFVLMAIVTALALGGCGSEAQVSAAAGQNSAVNVADETRAQETGNDNAPVADAVRPGPTAREFVDKAARSDAFEIASAKLAQDKARSAELKNFAAMTITDHIASTAKVKAAAAVALPDITPDPTLTADQRDMLENLRKLSGADFDKAYADQQIKANEDVRTLMESYVVRGDFQSLAVAAAGIAPKVQSHLAQIKTIRSTL